MYMKPVQMSNDVFQCSLLPQAVVMSRSNDSQKPTVWIIPGQLKSKVFPDFKFGSYSVRNYSDQNRVEQSFTP